MKWKLFAKTAAFVMTLLGLKEIPVKAEDSATDFTEDQKAKLAAALGEDYVDKMIKGLDKELKDMSQADQSLKAIKDEIDALVAESNMSEEEIKALAIEASDNGEMSVVAIRALAKKNKEYQALINELIDSPEGDSPAAIIKGLKQEKVEHSKTHIFGTDKAYDAFDDRNWNRRAAGHSTVATNFTDPTTIQKLNGDLDLYYRENPDELQSLQRDKFGLPEFWQTRTKVDDKVADGSIATAEISQARKLPWLPKNKQEIKAEEGQVFPIQIDIEYVGFYLQKIEASWLNKMNKEGSQPYKTSFVKYLVSEIDKKARVEDRVATIKGVYVETPEGATEGGRYLNRQNGLLYLAGQARDVTKKYRPFDLGMPTSANIVDYIDNFIKKLPDEIRVSQGLVLYLSDAWLRAYKRRYEVLHGGQNNYEGYPENPKDYDNIKFCVLPDMSGSDFMFMTFDDNIELLENIPAEKSLYHFEYLLRKIYVWADYKMGVRFIHIGKKLVDGDPDEFKVQTLWSNTAPVLPADLFVPIHDDTTGEINVNYQNLYVTKDWATDVIKFNNATPGTIIKIKGNTGMANAKNITDTANINLTGNASFNLKLGGTLTLWVEADGKVTELARTIVPDTAPPTDVNFNDDIIDANAGDVFRFVGEDTTAITDILNGVQGKTIKVYGTDVADVDVTFATNDKIVVNSGVTLGAAAHYLQLTLVDGKWRETKRVTA